jgi:hypothetical protein
VPTFGKLFRRHFRRNSAILIALTDHDALSQTTRTIKVIVPFPPGGSADIAARLLAEQIGGKQGPTIVVENRAGAGTVIGTQAVSHAAPDGNTVTPWWSIDEHCKSAQSLKLCGLIAEEREREAASMVSGTTT